MNHKEQRTKAQKIGDRGEQAALRFLLDKGYELVEKNYHSPYGEIDLIVKNNHYLVFVEVKTRNSHSIAKPSEFINYRKQKCILTTAAVYLEMNPIDLQPRFDAVEVVYSKDKKQLLEINHIENAFYQDGDYAVF